MTLHLRILGAACLIAPFGIFGQSAGEVRGAAGKSIALLQSSGLAFYKTQTCFSCHHQALPMMALRLARQRGVAVDEVKARDVAQKAFAPLADIDRAVQASFLIDVSMNDAFWLLAAHESGVAPSLTTAVYARRVAAWQHPSGYWHTIDQRPPQSHSRITATAIGLRAVQLYMPAQLNDEGTARVGRARQWLLTTRPADTEEHVSRLLGLWWAGAEKKDLREAAAALLALQRHDGGWAQLPSRTSDAYATGQALTVLCETGAIDAASRAFRSGLRHLLETQKPDGSWLVETRNVSPAPVSPPYFESEFPHGKNQFISAAATSWAAMALLMALPDAVAGAGNPSEIPGIMPKETKPWMETALFGTDRDLEGLLDAGLNPNEATSAGTSVLMMASADQRKVKLLIDRGANVQAKSKTGYTALMTAAASPGTSASVRLLLENGAEARPGAGVFFNASPLFFAAFAGDTGNVALLRAKGADLRRKMLILGIFPASPLLAAVIKGDAEMVNELIRLGAKVDEPDQDRMTPLHWAALGNRAEVVKALLAGGAKVEAVDRFGYTPLLYAATVDFGDTAVIETLLRARADLNRKTPEGRTALAQAQHYHYPDLARVLEAAARRR